MKYHDLLAKLKPCKKFNTLGGRSEFEACNAGGTLVIKNSKNRKYRISEDFYGKVLKRYHKLGSNEKRFSKNYNQPAWPECPGTIQSPYLPAIWEQSKRATHNAKKK
jgi:hypothetical protein